MAELKIIKERENPLFNRKDIEIKLETDVAPKTKEAEELIAKHFNSHADNVKIRKIKGKFGSKNFTIIASVYHTKEHKESIEPKKKGKNQTESKPEVKA